ncbi:MAG: ECF transporter S component [bacterium]|jgi:uncharacterized membrane protein
MNSESRIRQFAFTALFISLVTLSTSIFRIPVPATSGFINLGDTFIFAAALLWGPRNGFWAGSVGSALADVLSGYPHWAPFTFFIKGAEGLVAGLISHRPFYQNGRTIRAAIGLVVGGLLMVLGYFVAEIFLYGLPAAIAELPGNLFQATGSVIIALTLSLALRSIGLHHK